MAIQTAAQHVAFMVGIWRFLDLLYEAAASKPERKNLESIRRGEFETLKAEIGKVPERQPDFPAEQLYILAASPRLRR